MSKELLLAKIDEYIDLHSDDIANTLSELIRCNSLNLGDPGTADESEVQEYLANAFASLGMEVTSEAVDDPKRPNVVGKLKGTGGGSDVLFNGHADVVPPGDISKWVHPPFAGIIEDGKVYGRGAMDCKCGLTNMYWAAKAIKEVGVKLKGDCYLISSVGEESNEGGTVGAYAAVKDKTFNDPFCIVCEGSAFEIYPVSSGLFYFDITVKGKPVHIGRRNLITYPQNISLKCGPEVGVDALEKTLPFIDYFYRLMDEWNFRFRDPVHNSGGYPRADKSGVGMFTITPVSIKGGMYLGSVMDSVTIRYGCWYPEFADRDSLIEEMKQSVAALASTDMWLRENPPILDIPIPQIWRGFSTPYDHPGIAALKKSSAEVLGEEANLAAERAVCDATYFREAGIPVVVYGASHTTCFSHGFDENAIIADMVQAVKVYAHMIVEWCGLAEENT